MVQVHLLIEWEGERTTVQTVAELASLIDELEQRAQESPFVVTVVRLDTRDSLALGLGRPVSVLSFTPGTLDPPYLASLGDPRAEGVIAFNFNEEETEFAVRQAIPTHDARKALTEWARTGRLSAAIAWEEV